MSVNSWPVWTGPDAEAKCCSPGEFHHSGNSTLTCCWRAHEPVRTQRSVCWTRTWTIRTTQQRISCNVLPYPEPSKTWVPWQIHSDLWTETRIWKTHRCRSRRTRGSICNHTVRTANCRDVTPFCCLNSFLNLALPVSGEILHDDVRSMTLFFLQNQQRHHQVCWDHVSLFLLFQNPPWKQEQWISQTNSQML